MATEKNNKKKNKQEASSGQVADVGLDASKKRINMKKKREKGRISSPSPPEPESVNEVVHKKEKGGRNEYKKKRDRRHVEGDQTIEEEGEKKRRVIDDPRFASIHYDPRFQRMPRKQAKVSIDNRFARMLTDRNFAPSDAPVDKRGKRKKGKGTNPLLQYYLHQKDEEEDKVEQEGGVNALSRARQHMRNNFKEDPSSEEEEEDEEEEVEEEDISVSTSSESSSSDDDDDEEADDDDEYSVGSDIAHILMANHEDTPMIDTETHRLAVVNLDWSHIKAVDLYVIMNSCLPNGGQIVSVAVYPSEFGLKCLEIETARGPSGLIENDKEHDEDDSAEDNEKYRTYELNKLRYYFAVVVCDSSATANHIYNTLDGTELLKTSNVFDLRFIPDSMEFKQPPRDMATEAPPNYKEPDFETRALQHSKVKLTWEEDETERKKILRRKFNPNQLDELNEYLASTSESDDDEDDDEKNDVNGIEASSLSCSKGQKREGIEKLRALLQSTNDSDGDDAGDKDMEITFNTELEDLSKRILEKKDKKSETVWETVLRKRSEKRKAMKNRSKYSDEDDSSDYDVQETPEEIDDFFMEETLDTQTEGPKRNKLGKVKGSSRKGKRVSMDLQKEQEASRVELELLLADEKGTFDGPKGYNLKAKKTNGRKRKEDVTEEKLPDVDVSNDPRFSALLKSHLFALDPTDPQYKRSAAYLRQQSQKKKKDAPEEGSYPSEKDDELFISAEKEKIEFSSTVRSLKRNIGSLKIHRRGR